MSLVLSLLQAPFRDRLMISAQQDLRNRHVAKLARGMIKEHLALLTEIDKAA